MVLKSYSKKKCLKCNKINKKQNKIKYKKIKKFNFNLRIVLIFQLIVIFLPYS